METVILDMMPMLIFCDGDQHKKNKELKFVEDWGLKDFRSLRFSFDPRGERENERQS